MSIVSGSGHAGENDSGMQENQFAVWIRNVPTWLDEDRFYDEISTWFEVDKDKSHCFKNKQDSSWIGIRYGWAIVTFKSKRSRNKFLDDEDRHFVRETEDAPYEKLKVSPWYDKQKVKQAFNKPEKTFKIPLYKSDLEKELDPSNLTIEDFSRNCTDTSIQSYKGKIHSYITNLAGQGHVGNIEINVLVKNNFQSELVIFHSDSVWMHSDFTDCAVKCGTDNFLPNRLKIGSEVYFNARKIPHGMVEGKRYQAKAIWLGQDTQPNFITPPAAKKLDEYVEDYINESGRGASKDPSPEFESPRARSIETSLSTTTDSGTSSPLPSITIANRPKPLKGGLNQLNSSQDKRKTTAALKKPQPTNFAQAVSAAPTLIREEHSNLVLAVGFVESVISEVEAIISVPEHGTFNLHIKHLDLGYKPTQGIAKYVTAKLSTVSVTLKQGKVLPGSKPKYEIVRAHLNDDKKKLEDKFDPFVNEFKPRKKINQPAAPETWEELADDTNEKQKNGGNENGDFEIDLDELDEYYDDLQGIIEYLEKELPKVIPKIANDEKCFQTLANRILSNTRSANDEAKELQIFLDLYPISSRIKTIFIAEYIKFRSNPDDALKITKNSTSLKGYRESSPEKIENDFITAIKKTECKPEAVGLTKENERKKKISLNADTQEYIMSFLNWLKSVVKNKDILAQKIELYSNILQNNPNVAGVWLEVVKETKNPNFLSFVNKSKLGEEGLTSLKMSLSSPSFGSGKGAQDWGTVVTWLEGDTNHFRLEPAPKIAECSNGSNTSADTSAQLFKNMDLTNFEKEFVKHEDKAKETTAFIYRALVFLKKSEIKFEGLHKLHLRHMEESPKPRNREFNHKIQNILNKRSNQKLLDETNTFIQKSGVLKMKEHTSISYRRLDKFIPILSQSLCGFYADRHETRNTRMFNGEREKTPRKQELDDKDDQAKPHVNGIVMVKPNVEVVKSNQISVLGDVPKSENFCDTDYVGFTHFLELAMASGRITLAPTATVEGVLWTFQAKNISHKKLEEIYLVSQEQGGCSWQLQVSQLGLNPPLGVTVPEIAEYLSAYFGSVKNTPNVLLSDDDDDVVIENEEVIEVQDEAELMEMIQKNLYDQYQESELTSLAKRLKKGSIKIRENDMINSLEELYSSHYLFNSSAWPHNEDLCDFSPLCALLTAGIWHDLNVTSDFLSMCVRNIHEHDTPYQNVLVKWAKLLEGSTIFTASVMDIFTIIKATMISYDENVPEEDLVNISTNYCLYNVEGYVSHHLSEHFFAVQTRFSLVVCHLGTTYAQCPKTSSFLLPSDLWQSNSLSSCLPVGSRVLLHSTGIKDSKGKIICQIADIVWTPVDDKFDPPETGIVLPGNAQYKKYVQYFAEKHVAKTTPEMFGDTNYASNCHRYLALEEQHTRPVFSMTETWTQNTLEMQKMFVFSEMGGMARPLLRSNWAAALNTSDQEKERLLNETFNFFQQDTETMEMIEFISPYVERAGLRNAMKVLNQKYPGKVEEQESLNDTDSEKRQNLAEDEVESGEDIETSEDSSKEPAAVIPMATRAVGGTVRNRQLSTDTIKDETLWMAENNLEQLWADETEQMRIDRMVGLEEENEDDSEEYVVDDDNPAREMNEHGAIGSSKPKSKETVKLPSTSPVVEVDQPCPDLVTVPAVNTNIISEIRSSPEEDSSELQSTSGRTDELERVAKFEEAVCNLSAWQPVASDIISGNRDLIVQLNNRIEFLETALNQLTLSLATGGRQVVKEQDKEATEPKKGGRTYVKIAKEGDEEDIAEVPTNSEGLLPQMTVKALYEGTSAIKFRVTPNSKTWRALLLEEDVFHPPEEGWGDRVYTCTQPQGCVWIKSDQSTAPNPIAAPTSGMSLVAPGSSSMDHSLASPLTYSMGTMGQTNNIVSPFLAGLPPMAHIWGNGGLSVTSQVSPGVGVGQSMFGNMTTLGNMGGINTLGASGNTFKAYPPTFGKK